MVSIIIPNYNTAELCVEAVHSVLKSEGVEYEIIVVDDGGVEWVAPVLNKHFPTEDKLKIVRQENKGLAGARNTGIKQASGEFLVFLDSDDLILPHKLKLQSDFLQNNPEFGLVYSYSDWFIDDDPNKRFRANFPVYNGYQLPQLFFGNYIHVNAVMVRRSVLLQFGNFNPSLRELEDWDLWLRLSLNNVHFHCIPEVLSLVRVRKGSMTNNQLKMNQTMVRVLKDQEAEVISRFSLRSNMYKSWAHAYHLFQLNARHWDGFLKGLVLSLRRVGIKFLIPFCKLLIKRMALNFVSIKNKTTQDIEKHWKN